MSGETPPLHPSGLVTSVASPTLSTAVGRIINFLEEANSLCSEKLEKANELYRKAMDEATQLFVFASKSFLAKSSETGQVAKLDDSSSCSSSDVFPEGSNGVEESGIVEKQEESMTEIAQRLQEYAFSGLIRLYRIHHKAQEMRNLLIEYRQFLSNLRKVRTAKIVRTLIDAMSRIPNTDNLQVELCEECIAWCRTEKRTFLRHRVEARLCLLYMQQVKLHLAFELVYKLLKEVKKLDDKLLLVEIHLIESKLHFNVKNIAKSKAALTACRTNANAIHCSPLLQGDIDMQSGILNAYEKNYQTAFSYFFEAFEAFSTTGYSFGGKSNAAFSSGKVGGVATGAAAVKGGLMDVAGGGEDNRALLSLKYMMLAKIMCGQPDELTTLLSGKYGLKYANETDLQALKAVAVCHKERSLKLFEETLEKYSSSLKADPIIEKHISELYDTLLEQNILRVLEAFSRVEISHIAEIMELSDDIIQRKLCEMILDGKLHGTLDQGVGVLIHFDKPPLSDTYSDVLTTLKNMSDVVGTLYEKAKLAV